METKCVVILLLCWLDANLAHQQHQQPGGRVPPGVPPQHYDQNQQFMQHPPPQYQQQGMHPQQGVPMHQGQGVPIQQQQGQAYGGQPMHQQPQHQQQQFGGPPQHGGQPQHGGPPHGGPPHGGHGGGHGHPGQPQLLDASNVGKERQHIQEHMSVPIDTSQMSEQELQFHYFKMHDADNNNKLDGCELVKSLIHWHDEANHDPRSGAPVPEAKIFKDEELMQMIDPILQNDDKNKDGFIDYGEFIQAQAAASGKQAAQHAA